MIPKGSTTLNKESNNSFSNGKLVLYEQDGGVMLATILGSKKSKFVLLNMREREVEMNGTRLSPLPASLPSDLSSKMEQAKYLLDLYEGALLSAEDFKTEELWSFLKEDARAYEASELTEQYFGENTLKEHLQVRFALSNDKIYFKRKKNEFTPRPDETVEELKVAQEVQNKKERLLERTVEAFRNKIADSSFDFPEEVRENIKILELVAAAAAHIDNNQQKEAQSLIDRCSEALDINVSGKRELRAYSLLQKIGHFHRNTNLSFIKHEIERDFPNAVLEQTEEYSNVDCYNDLSDEEKAYRKDLTHLHAITIDDEATRDMDDALSVEFTDSGYRLGIHITDVSAAIAPGTPLDQDARLRATSVYCPERVFNMLPPEFSEGKLSLIADAPRRCLSYLVTLNKEFEIESYEITPSLVVVRDRQSYDSVEEILSQDFNFSEQGPGALHLLYNIAMTYEAQRLSQGALKIPKRMVVVDVLDKQHLAKSDFRLVEIDENGPSRSLIGEMMIMANNLAARFASENNIPFVFRSQEQPDAESKVDLSTIPEGPARDYAMRGNLKRSSTSLDPAPHATLGLEVYAQTTSPIRRFQDLCNQRQLSSFLMKGSPEYSADELRSNLQKTEEPLQRAMQVTRETRKFWLYKYLKKKANKKETIRGTVIRTDLKHPLVELDEIFITALLRIKDKPQRGTEMNLKIAAVDPRYDYLKLEKAE